MKPAFQIREFTFDDGESCRQLFYVTVRRVNCSDYTPVQINAWAKEDVDPEPWLRRFDRNFAYVAELNGVIVGFADMTPEGYLDRLFVSADHQRRGIATMLMNAIEAAAVEHGISRIHTQASITARPFFLSRGFTLIAEQTVDCRGVKMANFLMEFSFIASNRQ